MIYVQILFALIVFIAASCCKIVRVSVWDDVFEFDTEKLRNDVKETQWLLDNCEQIEAVYAYAVWKANSSFGQYISSVKFNKIKLTGSNVTNAAIDVYNDGPNWMKNESVPVDYYRSCGSQYWFIRITGQGASKREKKFCTAGFYLAELKWGYKCALYSIVYGSRRGLGLNPFAGFSDVCFPGGLCYAIFGIINFIIMTRVVKEIDKNRAATRVLHQAEIACDIFMVIVWHVPLCDIAKILINAIAGYCISRAALLAWNWAGDGLFYVLNDVGQIVLALLAYDRYRGLQNPMEYNADLEENNLSPIRRILKACLVVFAAVYMTESGRILKDYAIHSPETFSHLRFIGLSYNILGLIGQLTRAMYLFVCLFVIARSSLGMLRKLREMKKKKMSSHMEQEGAITLKRSLSLVLQTMALNISSLLIMISTAVIDMLSWFARVLNMPNADNFFRTFYYSLTYFAGVSCLNSNLGFFVHCYYSESYRDATRKVIRSIKQKLTCGFCGSNN